MKGFKNNLHSSLNRMESDPRCDMRNMEHIKSFQVGGGGKLPLVLENARESVPS